MHRLLSCSNSKYPSFFSARRVSRHLGRDVNVPDYRRLIPRSMSADLLGRDTIITSWACFPLYEYEWGSAFGGKCERVKVPRGGMFGRLQTVLPLLPERLGAGCEVMIAAPSVLLHRGPQLVFYGHIWHFEGKAIFCTHIGHTGLGDHT